MGQLYLDALKQIIDMFMPFIIIIIVSTIIVMIYRRYKYGIKFSDMVKKLRLNIDVDDDLLMLTLSKLSGKYEIIESDKLNAKAVILCKSGVYLLETCNLHRGKLTGELDKDSLEYYDDRRFAYIPNPFIRQENDIKLFKETFPDLNVHGFVMFGNDVLLDFSYKGKSEIVRSRNIKYKVQEVINLEDNNITNIDEVKEFLK